MLEVQDSIKNSVWSRFVREGVLDESRINKRISESWYICRQDGVNPYNGKGEKILQQNQLLQRKNVNSQLLHAALPLIRNLQKFFTRTKSLFLLVDSDGYILYMDGHPLALEKACAINFIEGVKWTEKEVGTNAVGTALRTKEPIAIIGAEHYAVASHLWGCASSPIIDDGQIAGVLNISYPLEYGVHDHMLPAVVSTAYAIEQKLMNIAKEKEIELIQQASIVKPHDELSLVCTEKEKIVWVTAHLQKELSNSPPLRLSELLNDNYTVIEKQPVRSHVDYELIGYKVRLKKVGLDPKPKNLPVKPDFRFDGVCGRSDVFQKVLSQAEKAARTNITVHLHGETGTGKEVMARSIHMNSERKDGAFVAVNCGTIPTDLIASELFGYARGAFTGADRKGHKGKFQQAHGGTLFLDEVAEIPQEMQVALLRVLEEEKVVPVGGSTPVPLDVRIITATHRNLTEMVEKGEFREDLYYRIYTYPIHLPSLKERAGDIPLFVQHYCRVNNWHVTFTPEVMECLKAYPWPGNIRELRNVLDRLRVENENRPPTYTEIQSLLHPVARLTKQRELLHKMDEQLTYREQIEKEKIMNALLAAKGNVSKAAEILHISRSTFYRKIKKFNL